jgi:uridine phosphorylase
MGGTPKRMENFAHFIMDEIGYKLPAGTQLQDISAFSYRYSMYKVMNSRNENCFGSEENSI